MKSDVLVVTRNLPPLIGGMERLIWHIVDELNSTYKVHVAGPQGCKKFLSSDVNVKEIPLKPMFLFMLRINFSVLWLAFQYRPHVILAGSGLTAPFVWLAARVTGARCVVYLHGLDIKVSHPLYRLLWVPFFRYFDCVLVNSNFTKQLALDAHIPQDHIKILHPGVELPRFTNADKRRNEFRRRYHLDESPVLLSVGRITSRKGLSVFAEKIFPQIILNVPKVKLVIIGDSPTNALLSDQEEHQRIIKILAERRIESKVQWLGCCAEQELEDAYFSADVLVFPVQKRENDIEGFGMVALEAAAHGLPTVAFSVGGVTDAVADGCSGKLISSNHYNAFADAVIQLLASPASSNRTKECLEFAELFEWNLFGRRLRQIFSEVEKS